MNYEIDKNDRSPAYIQLYRYLVKDIIAGVYPYGSKLPSKRIISEETGLSVITVEHAVMLLADEGYVLGRERSGSFVIYKGEDFLGDLAAGGLYEAVKETTAVITSEFPFSVIAKTMRRVILDYGERIMIKSPNHGCPELRSEICRYLARSRGIVIQPAQVIIGSGTEYLYGLIAQLLGTNSVIAIEDPSYKIIRKVYEAMGLKCDLLKMNKDGIATEELKKTGASVLHITPFNSYPSGVTADISKKKEYLRWAKQRNGLIIEDNYDSELTVSRKVEEPLFGMDEDVNVIYLNTFTRTLAPSVRVGYMLLPLRLVDTFNKKLGFYSCTVPIFDQFVLAELLKSGDFERHLNRVRRKRRNTAGTFAVDKNAIK